MMRGEAKTDEEITRFVVPADLARRGQKPSLSCRLLFCYWGRPGWTKTLFKCLTTRARPSSLTVPLCFDSSCSRSFVYVAFNSSTVYQAVALLSVYISLQELVLGRPCSYRVRACVSQQDTRFSSAETIVSDLETCVVASSRAKIFFFTRWLLT